MMTTKTKTTILLLSLLLIMMLNCIHIHAIHANIRINNHNHNIIIRSKNNMNPTTTTSSSLYRYHHNNRRSLLLLNLRGGNLIDNDNIKNNNDESDDADDTDAINENLLVGEKNRNESQQDDKDLLNIKNTEDKEVLEKEDIDSTNNDDVIDGIIHTSTTTTITHGEDNEQNNDHSEQEGEDNETLSVGDDASIIQSNEFNEEQNNQEETKEQSESETMDQVQNIHTYHDDSSTDSLSTIQINIEMKQNKASDLRIQGKQLHDDGDFQSAADIFHKAAVELDDIISTYNRHNDNTNNSDNEEDQMDHNHLSHYDLLQINEERATCRLHEALCHLKNKDFANSIISCTDVLMDGVQILPLRDDDDDDDGGKTNNRTIEDDNEESDENNHQEVIVRISANKDNDKSASTGLELSPAVRARAYHRRAKARLALGDTTGALDDARSAAFLGDRNAVALYGKLMRESGSNVDGSLGGTGTSDWGNLFSNSSPLESLFSGNSSENSSMNQPSSLGLLSSMLSDQNNDSYGSTNPFGAMGALGSVLNGNGSKNGSAGMDGLAKSLVSSVTKRIEDESTQEMVCNYLKDIDASQISSLSSMAGVPLSSRQIDRLVGFANGVTPKGMRRTIKLVKRILLLGNIMRKTIQVIGKYKHLIVIVLLIAWVKSAILRPVVVKTKVLKKTTEALTKATFMI